MQGVERHCGKVQWERRVSVALHHQIGVLSPGVSARTVDEEHVGRIDVGLLCAGFEAFQILQEPGPVAGEFEVRGEGFERRAQPFGIGGIEAFVPVAVVARRVGEIQQADQELETGEVQIGAWPVRPGDTRFPRFDLDES